ALNILSKKSGKHFRSPASVSGRLKPKPCANCATLRAPAGCGHSWTTTTEDNHWKRVDGWKSGPSGPRYSMKTEGASALDGFCQHYGRASRAPSFLSKPWVIPHCHGVSVPEYGPRQA